MVMSDVVTRRTLGILAVPVILATFVVGGNASAAPPSTAASSCPGSDPYPPSTQAELQVSTTHPRVGQRIEVSGTGYCADEAVTITLRGKVVARAHTDANGDFAMQVMVSGSPGDAELCGIGASGLDTDRDCVTLHVQSAGGRGAKLAIGGGGNEAEPGSGADTDQAQPGSGADTDQAQPGSGADTDQAQPGSGADTDRAGLAFTGAQVLLMTLLALGLLAVGAALVIGARRRRAVNWI